MRVEDAEPVASALCAVVRELGARQWCLATGGNFSARIAPARCLITQSGRDKSQLTPQDLMVCDLQGQPLDPALRPSAETALHTALYRIDPSIGAVLHTHSVTSTVVSRAFDENVELWGFEMQKALRGQTTHEAQVRLCIFPNTQDIDALAADVRRAHAARALGDAPGFLVRGHGLYAWGSDLAEAKRHVEGLEFLLSCVWQEHLANSGESS